MASTTAVEEKISEIKAEMKRLGLYKKFAPGWVSNYTQQKIANGEDFACWLQFVYLPNRLQATGRVADPGTMIVPQAMQFFGDGIKKGKLLQLLVELDSL
jgi:hypothetical protein